MAIRHYPPRPSLSGEALRRHRRVAHRTSTANWQNVRRARLALDGFQCVACHTGHDLTVHLLPHMAGHHDHATINDCVTLCRTCHGRIDN